MYPVTVVRQDNPVALRNPVLQALPGTYMLCDPPTPIPNSFLWLSLFHGLCMGYTPVYIYKNTEVLVSSILFEVRSLKSHHSEFHSLIFPSIHHVYTYNYCGRLQRDFFLLVLFARSLTYPNTHLLFSPILNWLYLSNTRS